MSLLQHRNSNQSTVFIKEKTESFKTLRQIANNIQFSMAKAPQSISLTSDMVDTGVSTMTANLARLWADEGYRVLLIDTNFDNPSIHKFFELDNQKGLSQLLANKTQQPLDLVQETAQNNLYALSAGVSENSNENINLMQFERLLAELKLQFELIICDTEPISESANGQLVAKSVDGTVLLIGANQSTKEQVALAQKKMTIANVNLVGTIMNRHITN